MDDLGPPLGILTSISGVTWSQACKGRMRGHDGSVPVSLLGRAEFVANERASSEAKGSWRRRGAAAGTRADDRAAPTANDALTGGHLTGSHAGIRYNAGMTALLLAGLVACVLVAQPGYPPPFPREGAVKLVENARVAIWDVTWTEGTRTPVHRHPYPIVGVTLAPGKNRSIATDGTIRENDLGPVGHVVYAPAGLVHAEEGASTPGPRAVLIELKDGSPPALPTRADMPPPFGASTPGATVVLDNDRVVVYDFQFDPKTPVPPHHHIRDAINVTVAGGRVRATTLDGQPSTVDLIVGEVLFRPRDRAHREDVVEGRPRNVIVELK